jgi:NAD(P)-dependent dehydrogenase (short-subunit alcohol dehydrogenase family)
VGRAGRAPPGQRLDKVMDLNVRGYFLLSQQVAKSSMIPHGGGRIINVSSIAGLSGNPPTLQTIAYNTSKAAVLGFTRTLAAEWGRYDITVNAICPASSSRSWPPLRSRWPAASKPPRRTRRCDASATTKT